MGGNKKIYFWIKEQSEIVANPLGNSASFGQESLPLPLLLWLASAGHGLASLGNFLEELPLLLSCLGS